MIARTLTHALATMRDAITGSIPLRDWSVAQYGRPPRVFVGVSPLEAPEIQAQAPLVALVPGTRYRRENQIDRIYGIAAVCAIWHPGDPAMVGDVTTWPGTENIDRFATFCEDAILARMNAVGLVTTQDPESSDADEIFPPIYVARWRYSVTCPAR